MAWIKMVTIAILLGMLPFVGGEEEFGYNKLFDKDVIGGDVFYISEGYSNETYVPYTGASSNVDLGNYNMSAAYYFGDGSQLTGLQQGDLILFFLDKASEDIAGNKTLSVIRNTTEVTLSSGVITTGDTLFADWTTELGVPGVGLLPAGDWLVHVDGRKTAGGTKAVTFFYEIYKTNSTGGDLELIDTSTETEPLTTTRTHYDIDTFVPELSLNSTDRIMIKGYARVSGVGGDPTVEAYIQGASETRLTIPVGSITIETFIPYTGALKDVYLGHHNLTANALTINTSINIGGTYIQNDSNNNVVDKGFCFDNDGDLNDQDSAFCTDFDVGTNTSYFYPEGHNSILYMGATGSGAKFDISNAGRSVNLSLIDYLYVDNGNFTSINTGNITMGGTNAIDNTTGMWLPETATGITGDNIICPFLIKGIARTGLCFNYANAQMEVWYNGAAKINMSALNGSIHAGTGIFESSFMKTQILYTYNNGDNFHNTFAGGLEIQRWLTVAEEANFTEVNATSVEVINVNATSVESINLNATNINATYLNITSGQVTGTLCNSTGECFTLEELNRTTVDTNTHAPSRYTLTWMELDTFPNNNYLQRENTVALPTCAAIARDSRVIGYRVWSAVNGTCSNPPLCYGVIYNDTDGLYTPQAFSNFTVASGKRVNYNTWNGASAGQEGWENLTIDGGKALCLYCLPKTCSVNIFDSMIEVDLEEL